MTRPAPVATLATWRWLTPVLVLLVLLALGVLLLGPVFWHPGQYLFGSGDGTKNYYTPLWYVQHDTGVWFTGMNYPFGEHVTYTDNQPLFSWVLGWLRRSGVALDVVAILNATMLLAQLISAFPVLALLRRCRLPDWYAAFTTVCIVLMAPQLDRLLGHYALSYSCAIPLLWYVLVRAQETGQYRWYALYSLVLLFFGCLHPYYLPIGALLLLALSAIRWWQHPPGKDGKQLWLVILLTLLFPLIVFQGGMLLTDPYAADRFSLPYGFFAYSSSVWSVFFPVEAPLRDWWQHLLHTPSPTWEGQAYVGLVGLLTALATLAHVAKRLRHRQWQRLRRPALPPVLRGSLWAGLLILLFSMGWPFRWGLEGLLSYLGPIRQFRSIGRFAWVFYYFYSVYLAYALFQGFRWMRQHRRPMWAGSLLALALLVWAGEGLLNLANKSAWVLANPRDARHPLPASPHAPDNYRNRLHQAGYQPTDFQAILPLPYYLLGSEVLGIPADMQRLEGIGYHSMRASLETELPLATDMLSRTAVYQAAELAQLLSPPAIDKAVLRRLPNRRPLLLVVDPKTSLDSAEANLLARAEIIYRDSTIWLARLPLAQLEGRTALQAEYHQQRTSRYAYPDYQASAATTLVWHTGFDQPNIEAGFPISVTPLVGPAAQPVRKAPWLLFNQSMTQAGWFEASVWAYLRTEKLPSLHWSLRSTAGSVLDSGVVETNLSTQILGDWARLTAHIQISQPGQHLRLWTQGRRYVLDEFELRPATATVWRHAPADSSLLIYNNYPLMPPPAVVTPLARIPKRTKTKE